MKRIGLGLGIVSSILLIAGCSSINIQSSYKGTQESGWENIGFVPIEDSNVAVGVQNDRDYFYLCLKTRDRSVKREITNLGLYVWLDQEGAKDKNFAVHFPLGRSGNPPEEKNGRPQFQDFSSELEIIGPDDQETNRMSCSSAKKDYGISTELSDSSGTMIYRLKLPFKAFARIDMPGKALGLGLETGELKKTGRPEMRPDGEGSPNMDVSGGKSNIRRHQGKGPRGSREGLGKSAEPLKIWAKVQLPAH